MTKSFPIPDEPAPRLMAWLQLHQESDRGMVVLSPIVIDNLLRRCLIFVLPNDQAFHNEVFQFESGALGSLTKGSQIAFAMGIIDSDTFQDIKAMNGMRNWFAHNYGKPNSKNEYVPFSFSHPDTAKQCASLKLGKTDPIDEHDKEFVKGLAFLNKEWPPARLSWLLATYRISEKLNAYICLRKNPALRIPD